jgi:molybdopterin converting factor small subunit
MAISLTSLWNDLQDLWDYVEDKVKGFNYDLDALWLYFVDIWADVSDLKSAVNKIPTQIKTEVSKQVKLIEIPDIGAQVRQIYNDMASNIFSVRDEMNDIYVNLDKKIAKVERALGAIDEIPSIIDQKVEGLEERIKTRIEEEFINILERVLEKEAK